MRSAWTASPMSRSTWSAAKAEHREERPTHCKQREAFGLPFLTPATCLIGFTLKQPLSANMPDCTGISSTADGANRLCSGLRSPPLRSTRSTTGFGPYLQRRGRSLRPHLDAGDRRGRRRHHPLPAIGPTSSRATASPLTVSKMAHFKALLGGNLDHRYAESCRHTVEREAAIGLDARIRSSSGNFVPAGGARCAGAQAPLLRRQACRAQQGGFASHQL